MIRRGAWLAALGLLAITWDTTAFSHFSARDLARALAWWHGQVLWHGPEMTGGGSLPGPFFYWLSWPAAWGSTFSWHWVPAWWTALAAIGIAYAWRESRRQWGESAAWLALVLLATSKHLRFLLNENSNSSAAPLFTWLAAFGIVRAFSERTAVSRRRAWIGAGLALGFGLQMHFNLIQLAVGAVALQAWAPKLGLRRLPVRVVALGAAAALAPSLPFLLWRLGGTLGFYSEPGSLVAAGGFSAAVARVSSAFFSPWRAQFGNPAPWAGLFEFQFYAAAPLVAIGLAVLAWATLGRRWQGLRWPTGPAFRALLTLLGVSAVLTIPILLGQDRFRARYAIVFELLLPVVAAVVVARALEIKGARNARRSRLGILLGIAAVALGAHLGLAGEWTVERELGVWLGFGYATAVLAWQFVRLREWGLVLAWTFAALPVFFKPESSRLMPPDIETYLTARETEAIAREVRQRTSWDFARFRAGLLQLNIDAYLDWSLVYASVERNPIDGASELPESELAGVVVASPGAWLTERSAAETGAEALSALPASIPRSGLRLLSENSHYVLAGYGGRALQNVGLPYNGLSPEDAARLRQAPAGTSAREAGDGFAFLFKPCDWPEVCGTGVLVEQIAGARDLLQARVFGSPLAQPVREVAPGWLEAWSGAALWLRCGERWVSIPLEPQIGYFETAARPHASPERGVVAPYVHVAETGCVPGRAWDELVFERAGGMRQRGEARETLAPLSLKIFPRRR